MVVESSAAVEPKMVILCTMLLLTLGLRRSELVLDDDRDARSSWNASLGRRHGKAET